MNDLLAHVIWVERTAELERLARVTPPPARETRTRRRRWGLRSPHGWHERRQEAAA